MSSINASILQITVNGEAISLAVGACVADVVAQLALDARRVAVEVNRVIVPRSVYAETVLREGDAVEIVRFIGGG